MDDLAAEAANVRLVVVLRGAPSACGAKPGALQSTSDSQALSVRTTSEINLSIIFIVGGIVMACKTGECTRPALNHEKRRGGKVHTLVTHFFSQPCSAAFMLLFPFVSTLQLRRFSWLNAGREHSPPTAP